ncbi:HlyD family secretion protein [Cyclobacterium marinum]|uniref:HlyD family secretion protein n=1 Tax=Cyclobacterium marinum TaxID=104 RepID=UPI0030DD1F5D|tara:strand:+ start:99674 stop:100660 length:987 start_codon:yes stop_codon:yes gene_type:complete
MMKKTNWFYVFIGCMLVSMLYISAKYFKGSGEASIGIAETTEYKVKTEKTALVRSVNVVPGMEVEAGQLLVELSSEELEVDIARLSNRISMAKAELQEKAKLTNAKIAYIKAENGIEIEELDEKVMELESEMHMNEALTKQFITEKAVEASAPMARKLNSLKVQKERHLEAQAIKIEDLLQESEADQHILQNQIQLLESELKILQTEKGKLNKYATASGVVEKVYVKPGEQVDAYAPLLEINPLHPTTVVAYLVGKKASTFGVGKEVNVASYDQQRNLVAGRVIGYGSVSELPEILQKSTAIKAFGQQVFIEIPGENAFFNGEKVLIR